MTIRTFLDNFPRILIVLPRPRISRLLKRRNKLIPFTEFTPPGQVVKTLEAMSHISNSSIYFQHYAHFKLYLYIYQEKTRLP